MAYSIFGFLNVEDQKVDEIVQRMFEALASRGGDSKTVHNENNLVMGVRGDADYVKKALVMNPPKSIIAVIEGEIYNFEELKHILGDEIELKNVFEAVVALYEKFGKDFPRYLNGIFSIALWDKNQKRLYLVRDHLGSHSLFYTKTNDSLFFATTLQSLLNTGHVKREVSPRAMAMYFSATSISPPHTMLKDVYCLRPGSLVMYNADGSFVDYDYWPIKDVQEDYTRGMDDFAEEVRELILDAITIRAKYGNIYGSLLSGGVDTGIISATLSKLGQDAKKKLPVFSIAFEEQLYSDAALQQIMYDRHAVEPHTAVLKPQEFSEILQKAITYLDSPVSDMACVGMYKAFGLAKQAGCSVVFDGEAADEIFYTGHAHAEREMQRYLVIPSWLRQGLLGNIIKTIPIGDSLWAKGWRLLYRLGLPDNERRLIGLPSFYKHSTPILRDQFISSDDPLYMGKKYLAETSVKDHLNIYYYGLLKVFLPDDLLFKNERMAAAHGIINRTPFIDYRLVELGYKIPQRLKITAPTEDSDGTKLVYKKAIKGLIPDEILNRKKTRGFSQPTGVWYRHELKDFVHDILFSQNSLGSNYLNKAYMHQLVSDHVSGKAKFAYLLNSLIIFELWLRAFCG